MSRQRHIRNKSKSLYIWHRYAGLCAALFVIFITISGMLLNHTDALSLKQQHIKSDFLLNQYNVQSPSVMVQFKHKQTTITQADSFLFIGQREPVSADGLLVGTGIMDDMLVLALTNSVLLVDSSNQVIETLSGLDGLPSNISNLGQNKNQQTVLLANHQQYQLNDDLSIVKTPRDYGIQWSKGRPLSIEQRAVITERYRANIISVETFILDVHSGRFFGAYGALFFDLIGILLLFLAITGIIIWLKQRQKK